MTTTKPLHWSDTVAARRLIASLDPDKLGLAWHQPAVGERVMAIVGEAPNGEGIAGELMKLRSAFADRLFGMTFLEASRQGRDGEYLALWSEQPEPQAALAEHFGDTMRFVGFSLNTAERLWRDEAKARLAMGEAA
jgi:hypothetical protein